MTTRPIPKQTSEELLLLLLKRINDHNIDQTTQLTVVYTIIDHQEASASIFYGEKGLRKMLSTGGRMSSEERRERVFDHLLDGFIRIGLFGKPAHVIYPEPI